MVHDICNRKNQIMFSTQYVKLMAHMLGLMHIPVMLLPRDG